MPLLEIAGVRAERDLRVDGRAAADAPAGDQADDSARAAVDEREANGPPEVVCRLRLPAREVGRREMGPDLEQQDVPPAAGELARDHPAARTRPDDDHVEAVAHPPIPRYDQSLCRRVASGELKSISFHAPSASSPGATKSL